MRTQDYENKQRGGTLVMDAPECQTHHRLYKGSACPSCRLAIPPGPYTSAQMKELFGSLLFIGRRRASDPAPVEIAVPITEREHALRADLALASARATKAKAELFRIEGLAHRDGMKHAPAGVDPELQAAALEEVAASEREWERLNRAARSEAAQRAGRMTVWLAKHPEAT